MKKQAGMTFFGMVFTVAVIVIIGVVIMRVVPVYLQYYSVKQSVYSLDQLPADDISVNPLVNVRLIQKKLSKQLYVNGIEIPENKILIKPLKDNKYDVKVTYDEKRSLVGNMSLLFEFDISHEVNLDKP